MQLGVALALFAAYAAWLTWPLPIDLASSTYGPPGDIYGSIAQMREIVEEGRLPFLPGRIPDIMAPEGQEIPWRIHLVSFPSSMLLWLLTLAFGATAGFNLFTILGYVGTAVAGFLVARRLTGSAAAGLLAGFAAAFNPYLVLQGQHPQFVHAWVIILMIGALVALHRDPTRRRGLLAAGATLLALTWTPYYTLLAGVTFTALWLCGLAGQLPARRVRAALVPYAIPAVCVVALAGALLVVNSAGTSGGVPSGSALFELDGYSARPLELALPPEQHPIFGEHTRERLTAGRADNESFYRVDPYPTYLGLSLLLLALVAAVSALRRRGRAGVAAVVLLSLTTVVCLLFAAPPRINALGTLIHMPSRLTYELNPHWRVVVRFVIPAMAALALLAAFGYRAVLDRLRSPAQRVAVGALIAAAVVLDLGLRPPEVGNSPFAAVRTRPIPQPTVYEKLKDPNEPDGILVEYPINAGGFGDYADQLHQNLHGRPVLGGYNAGSPMEDRAKSVVHLDDPGTAERLAAFGASHVLVRKPPVFPTGLEPPGDPTREYVQIADDFHGTLYRVEPRP